ncbi:MAG TPA: ABC transporter ATP-binding protein [Thermoprotei archaeon]|nr:ABC transporter ATP-binding protein [Thermoprotei archaeon]
MVTVRLKNITKIFEKKVVAADHITLTIRDGEFFTFLGPSGCGKTTLLRIIAGLEYPDEGKVFFDEVDVTELPPYKRETGMVFQNYALWPHMTVYENIAYGLKIRKLSKDEIRREVMEVLDLVKLKGLENRFPTQLSGGQQQRVALARALVIKPKVLLLDEPLSNLDAKLRVEMREEIKQLQRKLGITTIYVTHDQEEAMVISDRIAVMKRGKIMQTGTPEDVYRRPENIFVATFLGRYSLINGIVEGINGDRVILKFSWGKVTGILTNSEYRLNRGDEAVAVLRPEIFKISKEGDEEMNTFTGNIEWFSFVGPYIQARLRLNSHSILVNLDPWIKVSTGMRISVHASINDIIILPTGEEAY